MENLITIAIDIMGSDRSCETVVAGSVMALESMPHLHAVLVGEADVIKRALVNVDQATQSRIKIQATSQVVSMSDSPKSAVRSKKDSSMRIAIDLVHQGRAQAVVSCGNTGALVAISKFVLKTVPGIKRPAILSPIPSIKGVTVMLDLGANAVCTPRNLFEFAVMGAIVSECDYGVDNPRVGLLNIGTEAGKGTQVLSDANQLLTDSKINYVGFIEGNHIFTDSVDVVISDGFAGNVALKTMEGFAHYFASRLRDSVTDEQSMNASRQMLSLIDPRAHNGASLVGLTGVVVKSHGDADETAIKHAIEKAVVEIDSQLPKRIEQGILQYGSHEDSRCTVK